MLAGVVDDKLHPVGLLCLLPDRTLACELLAVKKSSFDSDPLILTSSHCCRINKSCCRFLYIMVQVLALSLPESYAG